MASPRNYVLPFASRSHRKNMGILLGLALIFSTLALAQVGVAPRAQAVLTCAQGGTCVVGNTGPGGGTVFYVSPSTFTCGPTRNLTCKYLEVAPRGWSGVSTDPTAAWGANSYNLTGVSGSIPLGIGSLGRGYLDSDVIITVQSPSTASGISRAYRGGGLSDWYLPSSSELNVLCKYARGVTSDFGYDCTGGSTNSNFDSVYYWGTSQGDYDKAYAIDFTTGNSALVLNTNLRSVRPIRSFSTIKLSADLG